MDIRKPIMISLLVAGMLGVPAKAADIVSWEELARRLPAQFLGLDRFGKPEGTTLSMGANSMSTARSAYVSEAQRVEVSLMQFQSAQNIMWSGPLAGLSHAVNTPEEQTSPVSIQGFKGRWTYNQPPHRCKVVIALEKSMVLVEVTANAVGSCEQVIAACEALPLAELNAVGEP